MDDTYTALYEKFSRLQWLLHRHHMISRAEYGPFGDTTRGQGRVLAMLKIQPEISTKDLSYLLGIKVTSLNELLNKLEKGGYIVRKPSEADKRVMIIHLTEKGKAEQQADADYSGIFDCLSPQEQEAFGEYLDRVIAALESQLGTDGDDEEMANWESAMRARMGDAQFEQMLSTRGGFGRHSRGPHGPAFMGGFDPGMRGAAPGRHGFDPYGRHPGCRKNPPPPPNGPHE